MSTDDSTIKIPIIAEADTTGFEDTQKAAEQTGAQIEATTKQIRAQQQAAAGGDGTDSGAMAEARRASAEAALEEEARTKDLAAQMELEVKTRRELQAELQRLTKARKVAAAAGDTAQYQKLTEQLERTKKAYTDMQNAGNLQKTAMMSQVNAGMQFANTLGSLSAQLKSGTVDVAGLTNGVMSLGMALKAGLGPIGWVMMAIQGLQMAWDYYAESQEKARKKEKESLEAERIALEEHWEAVEKFANKDREAKLKGWQKEITDVGKAWKEINDEANDKQRRANIEADAAAQRKRLEAQSAYAAEVASIELARTRGKITEEEARKKKEAAEEERAAAVAAIDEEELRRTNKAHIEAKNRANYEADALERALNEKHGAFAEALKVQMPTNEEWEALQLKLQANEYSMQDYAASRDVTQKVAEVRKMLEAMGIAWKGTDAELLKWLNSIRAAREEGEKMVKALRSTAETEGAAALEAKVRLGSLQNQNKADAERRAQTNKLEEAKHAKAEEEKKLREEWAEMQRKSLTEQEKWLGETAGSFRAGSEEAKKWARELRNVRAKQVAEALGDLEKQYKVTGNYVEMDNRTQAAIHTADEKALTARRAALEKLKASPNVDASTLKAINQKIKDTDAQLRGLRQAMRQSALEAQKAVANLRPLGQQAQTKSLQPALQKAEKAYVALAKRAERQASKGDDKGLERTMAAMRKNAAAQEKMTGFTGRAAAHMKDTEGKLRSIAQGTARQDRGLTAEQAQQNKVLASLGEKRRWHGKQTQAAQRAAKAKDDEARADEQAAQNAKKTARQSKTAQKASKTTQLAADVSDLRAQVQRLENAQRDLNANIGSLAKAVGALASAAEATATTASSAANTTASALGKLQSKQQALAKTVDLIRRKSP